MNPGKTVISDTTLISNFALVKRVELMIKALGRPIFTTAQVVDEISAGVQAGYQTLADVESLLLAETSPFQILALSSAELQTFRGLRLRLHSGEASCLAIAMHRGYVLGTDDLAARKVARANNVPVIGTVGVLALCHHGLLSLNQANHILQELISSGYRSPVSQLDDLWK